MPSITLTWNDESAVEDGYRVYRSSSPMDAGALPEPLAVLSAGAVSYTDYSVIENLSYFYRVAAFKGAKQLVGSEISIVASSAFKYIVSEDSPFFWLRLSEASGTSIADSSGGGRNAAIAGVSGTDYELGLPSLVGDTEDSSIRFKGNGGRIVSSDAYSLPVANITAMAVVQIDAGAPAGTIFTPHSLSDPTATGGSRDRFLYLNSAGHLVAGVWSGAISTIVSPDPINDGLPHILHFACGANASEGSELYLDGVSIGTMPYISIDTAGTKYFQVGKSNYSGWPGGSVATIRGIICEVAWFNSRLSATRVRAHAKAAGFSV